MQECGPSSLGANCSDDRLRALDELRKCGEEDSSTQKYRSTAHSALLKGKGTDQYP
jgi:hypothetical protein